MTEEQQHKAQVIDLFDKVAPGYDCPALRFFPFCADRLVSLVKPLPGHKVLDVATGTGAVAVAMAQAVGPEGRVHAIDMAEAMLTKAEANVRKMALQNVDFHTMDAEHLEFRKDYFHAVVCSFGLFFIPDMLLALTDWKRVTRPGGRIVFSSFAASAFHPMMELFVEQVQEFGGRFPQGEQHYATERLNQAQVCEDLMRQAGLVDVSVQSMQLGYHLASADDWWEALWNSGARGLLETVPEDRRDEFRQAHLARVAELATDDGIWMDVEVLATVGHKPTVP